MTRLREWSMPSNRGLATIRFQAISFDSKSGQVKFNIFLASNSSTHSETGPAPSENDFENEYRIVLPSIMISAQSCGALLNDFNDWLHSFSPFIRPIIATPSRTLEIQVGDRENYITSLEKPVFTFFYSAGSCRLEVFYVIDESCVRIASQELATVLQ